MSKKKNHSAKFRIKSYEEAQGKRLVPASHPDSSMVSNSKTFKKTALKDTIIIITHSILKIQPDTIKAIIKDIDKEKDEKSKPEKFISRISEAEKNLYDIIETSGKFWKWFLGISSLGMTVAGTTLLSKPNWSKNGEWYYYLFPVIGASFFVAIGYYLIRAILAGIMAVAVFVISLIIIALILFITGLLIYLLYLATKKYKIEIELLKARLPNQGTNKSKNPEDDQKSSPS